MIDHDQQLGVDLVALGQCFIQVHRTHHCAQVGGGKLHDRNIEVGDFIGRLARIEHLKEHDRIHPDHRIVAGDDFLPRNIEHLLHHIDLVAHPIDERDDQMQSGLRGECELTQPLDRIDIALPHDAHAHQQEQEHCNNQRNQETTHENYPLKRIRTDMLAQARRGASGTGQR